MTNANVEKKKKKENTHQKHESYTGDNNYYKKMK